MHKRRIFLSTTISGLLLLSACGSSENIATSKSGNLTKEEFNKELKELAGETVLKQAMLNKVLLDTYKISDDEAKKKVEELQEKLKPRFAFEKAIKASITENEIKDHYKPKLKASHILVKDEPSAKEIKEKLNNGEDFATLAKQSSTDPGTKEKGGELPEFGPGTMDAKFEEAAYKLEVGQVSDPVKSSYGYHIIKVTGKTELKPFDQEKENIRNELETTRLQDQQWQQEFLDDLLKKADIKVTDKDLKNTFEF